MSKLVDELLQKNPAHRPTIAQVLQRPILARLIDRFLTQEQKEEEFAHTVLHGHAQKVLQLRLYMNLKS